MMPGILAELPPDLLHHRRGSALLTAFIVNALKTNTSVTPKEHTNQHRRVHQPDVVENP
jgi:hypothetical protein